MDVTLIAALGKNRVIGRNGAIPWHVSADLQRFKALTTGHTIIMGRKTWESLPKRPLPDRAHVVVTRQRNYQAPGALVVHSVDDAISHARWQDESNAFVIGGGEIYAAALPRATRLELTRVHASPPGDTFFPAFDASAWKEVAREEHADHDPAFTFVTLERA